MKERFVTVSLSVKPGMHVLRYVSATDMKRPPRVVVHGKPGASEGVGLLYSPGVEDGALARFDDMVVISTRRDCVLMVTTISDPLTVSTDVELKLDPIARTTPTAPAPAREEPAAPAVTITPGYLQLAGHVQHLGDTGADASGWLGAPSGKARLEAFAVSWVNSIKGVRLNYGCEMKSRGRQTARVPGQLVGTRGQATPLTRVFFELTGSQAASYEFVATAAFAGSPPRTETGQRVELSGPTGQETLTGLKIDVRPVQAGLGRPVATAQPAGTPPLPERGRVRVFRAADLQK
jgi:hypothetical protein